LEQKILGKKVVFKEELKMAIFLLFVLFFVTFFPHNEMVSISNSCIIIIIIIPIGISTKDFTHHISMDEQNKDD
jgi:hypothetical protein